MKVTHELLDQASVPVQYRGFPSRDEISGAEHLAEYAGRIRGNDTVPRSNVYIHSENHTFAARVMCKLVATLLLRSVLCQCIASSLLKSVSDDRRTSPDDWNSLLSVRVLALYRFGEEPTNDFGKSLAALEEVLEVRASRGLPVFFASRFNPDQWGSSIGRPALAELVLEDVIYFHV